MRRGATARSKVRRQDGTGVSLFPFLAVLICTMGVLILLLIVIARHARVQAAEVARSKTDQQQTKLTEAREDARWWIGNLQKSLGEKQSQLAAARLELGHLEDHSRQIRQQLAELENALRQLDAQQAEPERRRAMADQIEQFRAQLVAAERRLDDARRDAREHLASYAVVPYQGPNSTRRRPIYVECRANSIVIQPEGVVLTSDDFDGPLGPDNPLAAAVRAAREYLLRQGALSGGASEEPYPLLLVRPSGIAAYYAAREAMQSWDADFGYELVGEDWKLDFNAPDMELAETLRHAIELARGRQQRLAAAAPRHYQHYRGGSGRSQYTVSEGTGGVVPYGSAGEPDSSGPAFGGSSTPRDPQPGEANPDGSALAGAASASTPSPAASDATARPGEWHPTAPSADQHETNSATAQTGRPRPLAKRRGQDWALPDASPRATPLVQPIRIECYPDRLAVVAQPGRAGGQTIPLGASTEASIDEFVSAVHSYVETWGIAGDHMYWRPTLNVYVTPGAERRFADIDALLKDSGLQVERKAM